MTRGVPFGKWDSDTHRGRKHLSVSPAARWLHFCLAQECRFRGWHDGRIAKDEALKLAKNQSVPATALKELLEVHFENPLLHEEADSYVIHDFESIRPDSSTARVRAWRAKQRETVATTPGGPPSPAPPSPPNPQNTYSSSTHSPEENASSAGDRVGAIASWACEAWPSGYPLAEHVEAVASVAVPLDRLLGWLTDVTAEEGVRGLSYFASGPGMGRLRELESEVRRSPARRSGRPTPIRDLLPQREAAAARERASSV